MRLPWCQAAQCRGISHDPSGLCPAHRRALTFTIKMQDSVREFLQGRHPPHSEIPHTSENVKAAIEAGEHLAIAAGLLIGTQFDDVTIGLEPITAPWRASFTWEASQLKDSHHNHFESDDDESDDDDEQFIEESSSA